MKNIILSVMVLGLTILTGCKTKEIQSHWIDQEITVDGNVSDWTNIQFEYFEDPNIRIGISNDSEYLYIMAGFQDQSLVNMFRRTGVTFWLDRNVKKKKDFGFRFKGRIPDRIKERMTSEQRARFDRMQASQPEGLTVITKRGIPIPLPLSSYGPSCALRTEKGLYILELRVPLQESEKTSYAIGTSEEGKLSFCLEMGQLSQEDRDKMREQMGGMEGRGGMGGGRDRGGMGGMSGGRGGMGGSGGMGDRGSGMQMPEKQELWITIGLANNVEQP